MYYDVIVSHRLSFVNTFLYILLIKNDLANRKLAQMPALSRPSPLQPSKKGL